MALPERGAGPGDPSVGRDRAAELLPFSDAGGGEGFILPSLHLQLTPKFFNNSWIKRHTHIKAVRGELETS